MKRLFYITTFVSFIALSMVMLPMAVGATDVTLAWDANSDQGLAGYRIYYRVGGDGEPYDGTGIDQGASPIDVPFADLADPDAPLLQLTGLVTGAYRFAATAYDANGNESGYSNEVVYAVDLRDPSDPLNLTATYDPETQKISLIWEQATDVPVSYWRIYYREAGQDEWIGFAKPPYSTTPTITAAFTAVAAGEHKIIEFTVVAFRDGGMHSADAAPVLVEIDRKPPAPPVLTIEVSIPVE